MCEDDNMQLNKISIKQILGLTVLSLFLSACQSSNVNKVVRDLPSPEGHYHVQVLQCRENDVMFGGATQVQVSVLKKGESESCRASLNSINQFSVNTIDFGNQNNALELVWLSENKLRAWHRSFAKNPNKNFIGPYSSLNRHGSPVNVIFSPASAQ
jgi:hypothetical protein